MKNGRWKVTSDKKVVNARDWWNAINEVKCMNHKLRTLAVKQDRHTMGPGAGNGPSPPSST